MNARSVDTLSVNTDYQCFYHEYLMANKACLFDSEMTRNWRSRQEWVHSDSRINIDYLRSNFGKCIVPVTECDNDSYDNPTTTEMTLNEYLDYFVASNTKNNRLTCEYEKFLYLKNWHFVQQFPAYGAYCVPVYFECDYLNDYWNQMNDDYKFLYLGPKGSWTPLHIDVFSSYSWSANIIGKKKWIFIKPDDAVKVRKRYKYLPNDIQTISREFNIETLEVIQNSGEIIFVPSNWMHQVFNLEDTLSINHNWFNACNLYLVWNELVSALRETEFELRDIRSVCDEFTFNEECQKILKSNYGMDYMQFFEILDTAISRITNPSMDVTNKEFRLHHEVSVIISLLRENSFLREIQLISGLELKATQLRLELISFAKNNQIAIDCVK